jgi:hypothetical protein
MRTDGQGSADQLSGCNLVHGLVLVVLGVDGTVAGDGVDLAAFGAQLGDLVALGILQGLYEAVNDIEEDHLSPLVAGPRSYGGSPSYLIARENELLGDEATANVATAKVNGLHDDEMGMSIYDLS